MLIVDSNLIYFSLSFSDKNHYYNDKPFTGISNTKLQKEDYFNNNSEFYKINYYAEYFKDGEYITSSKDVNIFSEDNFIKYINLMIFE